MTLTFHFYNPPLSSFLTNIHLQSISQIFPALNLLCSEVHEESYEFIYRDAQDTQLF